MGKTLITKTTKFKCYQTFHGLQLQYLSNVPVFFKVQLRKEQPELGDFYPRSALQAFQIQHSGLVVNGLLYKDGVSEEYVPETVEEEPCDDER